MESVHYSKVDSFNRKEGELTGYDCDKCHNKGIIMTEDEKIMDCSCMQVRRMLKLIKASGLEDVMNRLTFDSYQAKTNWQKDAKKTAQEFAKNPDGWLLVCGQSGAGKTHLCTAVAAEILKRGIPTLYMLWRSDSVRLKSSITDDFNYQRYIEPFKTVKCLYIDDFLKGKITDADINLAFEILDHRYRNDQITIISTERSPDEIDRIDEAICGRIIQKSQVIWLDGKEKNFRKYGQK